MDAAVMQSDQRVINGLVRALVNDLHREVLSTRIAQAAREKEEPKQMFFPHGCNPLTGAARTSAILRVAGKLKLPQRPALGERRGKFLAIRFPPEIDPETLTTCYRSQVNRAIIGYPYDTLSNLNTRKARPCHLAQLR
jgi:hypothetical protein